MDLRRGRLASFEDSPVFILGRVPQSVPRGLTKAEGEIVKRFKGAMVVLDLKHGLEKLVMNGPSQLASCTDLRAIVSAKDKDVVTGLRVRGLDVMRAAALGLYYENIANTFEADIDNGEPGFNAKINRAIMKRFKVNDWITAYNLAEAWHRKMMEKAFKAYDTSARENGWPEGAVVLNKCPQIDVWAELEGLFKEKLEYKPISLVLGLK